MSASPGVGESAPELELRDAGGRTISLADYRGRKVVLYFYPKSLTGGCTMQACSLRDGIGELRGLNVDVIGVSVDDVETQARFVSEHGLPFTILADADGELSRRYGVLRENGLARRVTFVIDEQGKILHVFDPALTDGHAAEVAAVLGPPAGVDAEAAGRGGSV